MVTDKVIIRDGNPHTDSYEVSPEFMARAQALVRQFREETLPAEIVKIRKLFEGTELMRGYYRVAKVEGKDVGSVKDRNGDGDADALAFTTQDGSYITISVNDEGTSRPCGCNGVRHLHSTTIYDTAKKGVAQYLNPFDDLFDPYRLP